MILMNAWFDSNGTRVRINRPYISQEETTRNTHIYDPNGRGLNYGLYSSVRRPSCYDLSWKDHIKQSTNGPMRTVHIPIYDPNRKSSCRCGPK